MKKNIGRMMIFIKCLLVTATYAQIKHDYVITMKNDTILCNLESQPFSYPKYHPFNLKEDSLIKISPDQIKEYGFHSEKNSNVSVKLTDAKKRIFLPRLENGEISLFCSNYYDATAHGSFTGTVTDWYASKGTTDSLILIKTNRFTILGPHKKQFMKVFESLIDDNKQLVDDFSRENDYGFTAIENAIKRYNADKFSEKSK